MGHKQSKSAPSVAARPQGKAARSGSTHNGPPRIAPEPPAYSPPPDNNSPASPLSTRKLEVTEDVLETLRRYDVVVLVDDSGSMTNNNNKSWVEARAALASLAEKAGQYDTDGVDVYFLNSEASGLRLKDAGPVLQLFDSVKPWGPTPIADRMEQLINPYLSLLEAESSAAGNANRIKPVDYIIITDGAPTDDPESVIVATARRLDAGKFPLSQLGIQFVQVADDPDATRFLRELDDELAHQHRIRDIVDTTPFSELGGPLSANALIKILLGGINRRVDRKGGGSV